MSAPLYFFPKLTRAQLAPDGRPAAEILARHGDLARAWADCAAGDFSLCELTGAGPGGASGTIVSALPADGVVPPRLHYAEEFQTWRQIGELWIGVDKEHPPAAADLRRKKIFQGYEVELAGEKWTIPVVRDPEGGSGLPRDFVYADGGRVQQRIKAAYLDLWEKFSRAVWMFFDPAGPWPLRMDLAEGLELCLAALALNYRVGRIEQNLLGLVDSESWCLILAAAVDYPTFRDLAEAVEAQKKTFPNPVPQPIPSPISREIAPLAESTATSPGPPDGSPATAPASAS
jgi:hypothetical protein